MRGIPAEIFASGMLILAAELGGFHVQVEPGESSGFPSGWEESWSGSEAGDFSEGESAEEESGTEKEAADGEKTT